MIVGIGNALSGDDAAGVLILDGLQDKLSHRPEILCINGGLAPENFTGVIRQFAPEALLFIDTALMDKPAGTIDIFSMDEIAGLTFSTHTLPPAIIAEYLATACSCTVHLIGLQPVSTGFETELSQEMQDAIDEVISGVVDLLG